MSTLLAQRRPGELAFERLYEAHVQDVHRFALMMLRNRADAEDLVQTTFMKAYRAFDRGERPRHPRRWLITIAHNALRTRARDAKRRPQEVSLDPQLTDVAAIRTNEDVDVRALVDALDALSVNQRSALVMRELEGRSYTEIAEVLELSSSAVETLLFRARRAIREQLEGPLTCGEAERALSLDLDGRLLAEERGRLRAHLRECSECATLARRQRARRAALRSLGPLPLPHSLASWGGGAAAGVGIGAKAAAVVAAGALAVGGAHEVSKVVDQPQTLPPREAVVEVVSSKPPTAARGLAAGVTPNAGAVPSAVSAGRTQPKPIAAQSAAAAATPTPASAAPAGASVTPTTGAAPGPARAGQVPLPVSPPQLPLPLQVPQLPPLGAPAAPQVPPVQLPLPPVPQVPQLPVQPPPLPQVSDVPPLPNLP